jgi:membrane-associated protease RseP (regulator of RpoE activity)
MSFAWLQENALVILFYVAVALIIYFNRKKFEFQGIVALFKTTLGIKQMKKFATPLSKRKEVFGRKFFNVSAALLIFSVALILLDLLFGFNQVIFLIIRLLLMLSFLGMCVAIVFFRQIKAAGKFGIYVGFLGMLFMVGLMLVGLYQLFFVPTAPPMFAPVLPGLSIPGSPFKLPLFEGLIALLIVVAIHEFSHGVVSKAYKIPIKSSGFVMFGPLPGAFVEPDEKKLKKASSTAQLSVYAAGPFSNVLLAGFLVIILTLLTVLTLALYESAGVRVDGFVEGVAGNNRGLEQFDVGEVIVGVNNQSVNNTFDLIGIVQGFEPGDTLLFVTKRDSYLVTLGSDPRNESRPFIGLYLDTYVSGTTAVSDNQIFKTSYFWLVGNPFSTNMNNNLGLLWLIFILSFGIGIVNLLPIGPLDGGRMSFLILKKRFGEKKAAEVITLLSKILIFFILVLIFIPIFRAVF